MIGSIDSLLAGSRVGEVAQSLCCSLCGFGSLFLSRSLRHLEDGKRVALMDEVTLLNPYLHNPARQLARNTILLHFNFTLDYLQTSVESEETNECYCHNHEREAQYGKKNVVML